ncbi:MAG: AraC family transcriptional regulator [Bacteroidaceae bacterium]|nr:AraC family transcriptional regulator [Bacteroidaceae bacterium]
MQIDHLDTIAKYNERFGFEGGTPLVNVVDFSEAKRCENGRFTLGFYIIKLKTKYCGDIFYGRTKYDYTDGSIFCFAPDQLVQIDLKEDEVPTSVCLLFHPDLIRGTELGQKIRTRYPYFSYDINEALQISEEEKRLFMESMERIKQEIRQDDPHSIDLIRINIELLLEYLLRLYDRQFQRRSPLNQEVLSAFENKLHDYFSQHLPQEQGLPTVEYFARESGYTSKYFSDLIKKSIGMGAQDYITSYILDQAKHKLLLPNATIKETAYELGFQHPQHFTRFFKNQMGCTPKAFAMEYVKQLGAAK